MDTAYPNFHRVFDTVHSNTLTDTMRKQGLVKQAQMLIENRLNS